MYQKYGKRLMDMLFSVIALINIVCAYANHSRSHKTNVARASIFSPSTLRQRQKAIHYQQIPHDVGKSSKKHAD